MRRVRFCLLKHGPLREGFEFRNDTMTDSVPQLFLFLR
jgi:hypothetical protein